jgi:glycerate 2-kinase
MTSARVDDALAISEHWLKEMDLVRLTRARLETAGLLNTNVDVVAIGKASREMSAAVDAVLGARVQRRFIVCDEASATADGAAHVLVGEHPVPGEGSRRAGEALISFLEESTSARSTLFLLSGGASSLCVLPAPPVTLEDLRGVWDAALAKGADITTLNKIRASTSALAGGGVLRHVGTTESGSLILVDNVISGAEWVASGLTYDYEPGPNGVALLLEHIALSNTALGARLLKGYERRARLMAAPPTSHHENYVLAEPSMMLDHTIDEARRRHYRVVNMGSRVHGDVASVVAHWKNVLRRESNERGPTAFVGVGEVTVKVEGTGTGGRCQEFAWLMAQVLADLERDAAFVARASDGRDYVSGVGGAWVESSTMKRLSVEGISWSDVVRTHDTYPALKSLGQLIDGGHTGWNLCDVYVALR